jgi:hypothetical protein
LGLLNLFFALVHSQIQMWVMHLLCAHNLYMIIAVDDFQSHSLKGCIFFVSITSCGLVISVLATGPKVRGFDPDRGRWIFKGDKNPEHRFLRRGSKAVGPMS